MSVRIQSLGLQDSPGEDYHLASDKLIRGNPRQTLWLEYSDATRQFHSGIWRSEPGQWRVAYTEEEYCQMIAGVCVLRGDDGSEFTARAGDSFVVPRGFVGTWEVVEAATKRFVIYEAAT